MAQIHSSAIVAPGAQLGAGVVVGPLSIIEDDVVVGDDCQIAGHVVIKSGTTLGRGNVVHEGAVIGGTPQHLGAKPVSGRLRIGDGNLIREHVTIQRAWLPDHETVVGDRCMLMVNAHVAHDCHVGDSVILANNVMLAGHVTVGERAYLSGAAGVHQFCTIGRNAMVGGQAHINRDVLPFVMLDGDSSRVVGLNVVGLRRSGYTASDLRQLKEAYRIVFRRGLPRAEMLAQLEQRFTEGPASLLAPFLRASKRGIMPDRSHGDQEPPAAAEAA